jgi:hypothetical protein
MERMPDPRPARTAVPWIAIGVGTLLLFFAVAVLLMTLLSRWGHSAEAADVAPSLWMLAAALLVLIGAVVAAVVGRRWVALVLSLLLLLPAGAGVLLLGSTAGHEMRSAVPQPAFTPTCFCYSGGSCDCPGG